MDKFKVNIGVYETVPTIIINGKTIRRDTFHLFDLPVIVEAENYAYAKEEAMKEFHRQVKRPNGKPVNCKNLKFGMTLERI